MWSNQFYHYASIDGSPAIPHNRRLNDGRGEIADWALHFHNADIVLMPDKWEYPWYASLDLVIQAVVMATIDPTFAKGQMMLLAAPRSLVDRDRLAAILQRVLNEEQFLSEYGVRSLSRAHSRRQNRMFGDNELFQNDAQWRDYIPFHEYFHGETGEGLGAGHQTGWTALGALLIQYGGQLCFERVPVDAALETQEGKVA